MQPMQGLHDIAGPDRKYWERAAIPYIRGDSNFVCVSHLIPKMQSMKIAIEVFLALLFLALSFFMFFYLWNALAICNFIDFVGRY